MKANQIKTATITLDSTELSASQLRLVRIVVSLLTHVLTTDEESEYFDTSAEIMTLVVSAIKQSSFNESLKDKTGIPYADQAIEYSMDALAQNILNNKIVNFDN